MITTSDNIILAAGSRLQYAGPDIVSRPQLLESGDSLVTVYTFQAGSSSVLLGQVEKVFTTAELTAFTSSGANEVEKYYSIVELAVVDWLEGLNPSATLTLA